MGIDETMNRLSNYEKTLPKQSVNGGETEFIKFNKTPKELQIQDKRVENACKKLGITDPKIIKYYQKRKER